VSQKLPRVTADKMIKVIEKSGFFLVRQSGGHKIYKNERGKTLHPKVVKSILRDADISIEEFKQLLK